ncbi:MAG: exodeoxyribonuclease III [Actinobacteria bacterium]|nr:exodeoxyribonuclease III [Actinomycetota bacterium]MBW3647936.1 exodeoxyribonuclease III [Actinomycetota bacterium]
MRLATWNVNSIGARLPRLLPWLEAVGPDVVALQETKCADNAFPYADLRALGYEAAHAGDGRWNGVAVLSRLGVAQVSASLDGHPEPRLISAQCGPLHATSVYVPNGRALGDPHYAYKLDWLAALRERLESADPAQPLVVMGDLNVALHDADVWDIRAFSDSTHVTPAERAALQALLDWGLVDVEARPGKGEFPFTYWDYRAGMMHKNLGMRIDYVLATRAVTVRDAWVDREARKGKGASDHAPVVVDLDL